MKNFAKFLKIGNIYNENHFEKKTRKCPIVKFTQKRYGIEVIGLEKLYSKKIAET